MYKLSKWFLMLPLFLSVFAFSGFTGVSQSLQQKDRQTELVLSNKYKVAKRTILFKRALSSEYKSCTLKNSVAYQANYLFVFNCLDHVNFKSQIKQFYSFYSDIHYIQIRTNPESPDEECISSIMTG